MPPPQRYKMHTSPDKEYQLHILDVKFIRYFNYENCLRNLCTYFGLPSQSEVNRIRKKARLQKINNIFTFARQANKGNSGSAKVRHTVKGKIIKRCIFILIRSEAGPSRGIRGGEQARYLKLQAFTVPISRHTVLHSFMFSCHFQTYFYSNYSPDAYFMRNDRFE